MNQTVGPWSGYLDYSLSSARLSTSSGACLPVRQALEEQRVHIVLCGYQNFLPIYFLDELNWRPFDDAKRLAFGSLAHHKRRRGRERIGDIRHRDLELSAENIFLAAIVPYSAKTSITECSPRHARTHRSDPTVGDHHPKTLYFVK